MKGEYGEPWVVEVLTGRDGSAVAHLIADGGAAVANTRVGKAHRIVACVNALAGIKNPGAVAELIRCGRAWKAERNNDRDQIHEAYAIGALMSALAALDQEPGEKP